MLKDLQLRKRFAGVKEAISEYGVELIKVWDQSDSIESEQVYEDLKRMKEEGSLPTLIMCSSDAKAQSLIFTLNRLGLEVPKDISVTGYNSDLDETETIPLTSIGFSKKRIWKTCSTLSNGKNGKSMDSG